MRKMEYVQMYVHVHAILTAIIVVKNPSPLREYGLRGEIYLSDLLFLVGL